jgi:hypothetical protein
VTSYSTKGASSEAAVTSYSTLGTPGNIQQTGH